MKLSLPEINKTLILTSELVLTYNSHDSTHLSYEERHSLYNLDFQSIWSSDKNNSKLVKWDAKKIHYYYGFYDSKITIEERDEMFNSIEDVKIIFPIGTKFKFSKIEYSLRNKMKSATMNISNLDKEHNIAEGVDVYGKKLKPFCFRLIINSRFIDNIEFEYFD